MTYENLGRGGLDYFPCRYGMSKLLFRGPRRRLNGEYNVFVGGAETYGKFTEIPFPLLVEHETGIKSVNLGCVNAGIDAVVKDESLVDICAGAKVVVIELLGAQNMSNRFYMVHPRRNDRFLNASKALKELFPGVDFTDITFTRHLLTVLKEADPEAFAQVEYELKDAWIGRMNAFIKKMAGKVVLLWMADHSPDEGKWYNDPILVDRNMITSLSLTVDSKVEVVGTEDEKNDGFDELIFGALEEHQAENMLGPVVHRRAAAELSDAIGEFSRQ